mmetsp:Transcript_24261/g.29102  ORF Transcript_24261/g.29102 Transcript_24261/m.29102 type:complete len:89 (+) Transcript_24261:541-807(+)|eukprot:CAMPEP_0195267518 /NCGR_PEP_ID=MMETSP0706-20130129/12637_1 /TAXON_ID=33640 /ORGANISM="Asterionellopsis glacialis, Strain CCMP134" /LENGTH=88 /DNA_ID=CAMNT_0040322283 /DNA_START=244 /DNA_END=510 /DNA_ORIENTATION=+
MSSSSEKVPPVVKKKDDYSPTALQMTFGVMLVGASAGLTLYTKKTQSMLNHMDKLKQQKLIRNPPPYGPVSKKDYEKMKPRLDKDEFF